MWFKDAIVYHILVDRFAGYNPLGRWDKPVFLGGNLQGVADKLPYLDDLGINAIWLSPICKSASYHGYHITDFSCLTKCVINSICINYTFYIFNICFHFCEPFSQVLFVA